MRAPAGAASGPGVRSKEPQLRRVLRAAAAAGGRAREVLRAPASPGTRGLPTSPGGGEGRAQRGWRAPGLLGEKEQPVLPCVIYACL